MDGGDPWQSAVGYQFLQGHRVLHAFLLCKSCYRLWWNLRQHIHLIRGVVTFGQVCAAVMRAVCEGGGQTLQLEQIVELRRTGDRLLQLVEQGLDASPRWLEVGVRAGADVLTVLQHCLAPAGHTGAQLERLSSAGTEYSSCTSRSAGSGHLIQLHRLDAATKAVNAFTVTSEVPVAAPADLQAAAAHAASRLVLQDGGVCCLTQLLQSEAAQRSVLACIAVLACSPESAAAIVHEEDALEALAACIGCRKPFRATRSFTRSGCAGKTACCLAAHGRAYWLSGSSGGAQQHCLAWGLAVFRRGPPHCM